MPYLVEIIMFPIWGPAKSKDWEPWRQIRNPGHGHPFQLWHFCYIPALRGHLVIPESEPESHCSGSGEPLTPFGNRLAGIQS